MRILRIDDNPAWGEVEYYSGRALFQSPNLAFINFDKIKLDDKKRPMRDPRNKDAWLTTQDERILCTGNEVWQYKSDTQQVFIFPLNKDEKAKAMEEGPLPFLFNMCADDARRRYQMKLISQDAKSFGVSIIPKLPEDQGSFSVAFVNLDRKYLLPVRIVMKSPDGKSTKDYQLPAKDIRANFPINPENFKGKVLGPPWKIVRNPGADDAPGTEPARGRRNPPAQPSAARPRQGSIGR